MENPDSGTGTKNGNGSGTRQQRLKIEGGGVPMSIMYLIPSCIIYACVKFVKNNVAPDKKRQ